MYICGLWLVFPVSSSPCNYSDYKANAYSKFKEIMLLLISPTKSICTHKSSNWREPEKDCDSSALSLILRQTKWWSVFTPFPYSSFLLRWRKTNYIYRNTLLSLTDCLLSYLHGKELTFEKVLIYCSIVCILGNYTRTVKLKSE